MTIFFIVIAYLVGSISSAIIVSQLLGLKDPRDAGSQNPGATNMLRLAGRSEAFTVLFFDILKGFLPVFVAKWFGVFGISLGAVALAAVLGHIYPVFYSFKGGKGFATTMGCMFGLHFTLGIFLGVIWLAIVAYTRYASLGSLITVILLPFLAVMAHGAYFMPLLVMSGFVIVAHRDNIRRLIDKEEEKITLS